jgi:hypothetical protein
LARLGVAGELSELVSEGEGQLEDEGGGEESVAKAPTAQDFADIAEVVFVFPWPLAITCVRVY